MKICTVTFEWDSNLFLPLSSLLCGCMHEFILCYTCNRYWSVELERKKKGRVPRLWFAWFKCFWMRIIFQGFVLLSVVSIVHNLLLFHVCLDSQYSYFGRVTGFSD